MTSTVNGPVVVGMDGSDEAARAAAYGAWEARRRQYRCGWSLPTSPTPMWGPAMLVADDYEWVADSVREMLIKAEKDVTVAHPDIAAKLPSSPAARRLPWSRSPAAPVSLSSAPAPAAVSSDISADRWPRRSPRTPHAPVIVLRPNDPTSSTRRRSPASPVVVGLDGSAESQHALDVRGRGSHRPRCGDCMPSMRGTCSTCATSVRSCQMDYEAADEKLKALRLLTEATEGWSRSLPGSE